MPTLGQAYVEIMPSAKGISGKITQALGGEPQRAGEKAGSDLMGSIKKAIAAVGVGKVLKDSLFAGGDLQQSIGGIETLYKESADTMLKYANEAYKTTGLSANDYMQNVTGFTASLLQGLGGDTAKAAEISNMAMIDMADNANKMGTDMSAIQSAYQGFAKQNYTMLDNLKLGYGGTKTEMERLLKDAQAISGIKYDISNLADVYSAIHVIQENLDITGTTAKEAASTFTGSLNAMKAATTNLLANMSLGESLAEPIQALGETVSTFLLGNFIPMLSNVFKSIPSLITGFVSAAKPAILSAFSGLFESITGTPLTDFTSNIGKAFSIVTTLLGNTLGDKIPELAKNATEMLTSFIDGFSSNADMIMEGGMKIVEGLSEGISKAVPIIMEAIPKVLQGLLTIIMNLAPKLLQAGMTLIRSLSNGIVSSLPELLSNVLPQLLQFTETLRENFGNFVDAGLELITSLAQGLIAGLPSLIMYVPQIITNIAGLINDNMPKILETGWNIILALGQGIINSIPLIIQNMGSIVESIVSVIQAINWLSLGSKIIDLIGQGLNALFHIPGNIMKNLANSVATTFQNGFSWSELGRNIINGIINGIKNGASALADAAKNAAKAAFDAAKNFLGIESPSKLFYYLGEMTTQGYVNALKDGETSIVKEMKKYSDISSGTLESEIASNALKGNAMGNYGHNSMSGGYTQNITINSPKQLSAAEVARQTKLANQQMILQLNNK